MALVTMKRLFDHAMKEKYTVGAYNVFNLDTLVAVLQAAEKENSPVIVQLSMGSRKYQPYFETFVRCVKLYAEAVHVPVGLNHDHCKTVENAKEEVKAIARYVTATNHKDGVAQAVRKFVL